MTAHSPDPKHASRLGELVTGALELLELDGPVLRTAQDLFVDPARVYREIRAGKRERYARPIAYASLSLGLLIPAAELLTHLFGPQPTAPAFAAMSESFGASYMAYFVLFQLLAVPSCAALMRLLLRRAPERPSWRESAKLMLYGLGQIALIQLFMLPLPYLLGAWSYALIILAPVLYLSFLLTRCFGTHWASTGLRAALVWFVGPLPIAPLFMLLPYLPIWS